MVGLRNYQKHFTQLLEEVIPSFIRQPSISYFNGQFDNKSFKHSKIKLHTSSFVQRPLLMFFFPELGSELEGVWEPMREASQVELESSSESIPRSFSWGLAVPDLRILDHALI